MNERDENLIEQIVRLMRTDDSTNAPPDAVRWSKNLFRTRSAAPKKSFAQKVLAVLQTDLLPGKAAFGERSAGSFAQARQMFFGAGENAVDLRIAASDKNFAVRGQVLGAHFANCTVRLGELTAQANDLSEFEFSNVPAGVYECVLRSTLTAAAAEEEEGEREIVIANLELK